MNLYEIYAEIIKQYSLPEDKLKYLIETFLERVKQDEKIEDV